MNTSSIIIGFDMIVFLDDERITPAGWVRAYWPEEVIELLETGNVTIVSLDHDLGDDAHGTGYDVIVWIEEAVITRNFKAPKILIHSANSSARVKMELGVDNIIKNSKP
ncbi:cyclic-phosphate processing receiver domain-containing protein [Aeromonas allosaccharophila]|uniref:cyclic-phosphate processing receiver domain-containing protein n=1 Tax=Aeromonas allosaccharophila TaxID=656 RepID=UPI0019578E51|nr:cyclic-phosphate processing receiver domain-containing protein [Aeromonas allosaccharophila]